MTGMTVIRPIENLQPEKYGKLSVLSPLLAYGLKALQQLRVDVGFGSASPISPLPLPEASSKEQEAVPGSLMRLVNRAIAPNTTDHKFWVLELKNTTTNAWSAAFCFAELVWLPQDFDIINYRTQQDQKSWFTYKLVLVRMLIDEETRTKAIGSIILTSLGQRLRGG
ncbi:hypothetical protein DER45DRAFT_596063 [Fusarium avenaceum]|nr:hypothetical protein DER45DRAFT_596063 [Fusarium avenaceum]